MALSLNLIDGFAKAFSGKVFDDSNDFLANSAVEQTPDPTISVNALGVKTIETFQTAPTKEMLMQQIATGHFSEGIVGAVIAADENYHKTHCTLSQINKINELVKNISADLIESEDSLESDILIAVEMPRILAAMPATDINSEKLIKESQKLKYFLTTMNERLAIIKKNIEVYKKTLPTVCTKDCEEGLPELQTDIAPAELQKALNRLNEFRKFSQPLFSKTIFCSELDIQDRHLKTIENEQKKVTEKVLKIIQSLSTSPVSAEEDIACKELTDQWFSCKILAIEVRSRLNMSRSFAQIFSEANNIKYQVNGLNTEAWFLKKNFEKRQLEISFADKINAANDITATYNDLAADIVSLQTEIKGESEKLKEEKRKNAPTDRLLNDFSNLPKVREEIDGKLSAQADEISAEMQNLGKCADQILQETYSVLAQIPTEVSLIANIGSFVNFATFRQLISVGKNKDQIDLVAAPAQIKFFS